MHGMINRAIEAFVADTYGPPVWAEIATSAQVPGDGFETLQNYDDDVTMRVVDTAADRLRRERDGLLEDIGHYIVTNPGLDAPRRLLRFGGETFTDFLHSLEDLHDRARLALPDLDLPRIAVVDDGRGHFSLRYTWAAGLGAMIAGALRAMADDYGALVLIEVPRHRQPGDQDRILVRLLEPEYADGRAFSLGRGKS